MMQISNSIPAGQNARLVSSILAFLLIHLCAGAIACGQSESSVSELRKAYETGVDELRSSMKELRRAGVHYFESDSASAVDYKEKWEAEALVAEATYVNLQATCIELFLAEDKPDASLVRIVRGLSPQLIKQGQLTTCFAVTKKLLAMKPDDQQLRNLMGRVAILNNDFETASGFAKTNKTTIQSFPLPENGLYGSIDVLTENFSRELEFRSAEAEADDLPRVELETTKGKIIIELFENEAPETVGNFISLVEAGFYDGIIFHNVIQNAYARCGVTTMRRPQPVGYTIYDEHQKPGARHHFRGTVSMMSYGENTGGAEFMIMRVPAPNLDGRTTVFGRVIAGLRVLDVLQNTFSINDEGKEEFNTGVVPDVIKSAKVIRKRDHEYEPNLVKE